MFEFRLNEQTIGYSRLEWGDPPMGIAYGEFVPKPNLSNFLSMLTRLDHETESLDGLEGITPDGVEIKCQLGITLLVYDLGEGESYYEVQCLGVYHPDYKELFPHHVKSYEESFNSYSE